MQTSRLGTIINFGSCLAKIHLQCTTMSKAKDIWNLQLVQGVKAHPKQKLKIAGISKK